MVAIDNNLSDTKPGEAQFAGKKVSVIGAARSGLDAARVLQGLGANVLLSDAQTAEFLGAERIAEIEASGVPYMLGVGADEALPIGTEFVITSPGVPRTAEVLQAAVRRSIPVWSEIELAGRLAQAPIIAITGTNGKTTTTLLTTAILKAAGFEAIAAGNISADEIKRTLVDAACKTIPRRRHRTAIVAEISSFQLEWVEKFAPKVAILTNITPDHLNRHATFEEYAAAKARIFAAQNGGDFAIVNYDNAAARAIGELLPPARRVWFTLQTSPPDAGAAAWLQNGLLTVRLSNEVGQGVIAKAERGKRRGECVSATAVSILPGSEMPATLPGSHSIENALAAAAAALIMGVEAATIAQAIRDFAGVPHRMEWVEDVRGIRYINNSMCTNVAAAISSLRAMDRPTVAIMGGADKELAFAPLADALKQPDLEAKISAVVLIGAAADKIEKALREGGYTRISRAGSMADAVTKATERAAVGQAVLLCPACASFDMFHDFEARGAAFRDAVRTLSMLTIS